MLLTLGPEIERPYFNVLPPLPPVQSLSAVVMGGWKRWENSEICAPFSFGSIPLDSSLGLTKGPMYQMATRENHKGSRYSVPMLCFESQGHREEDVEADD